MITYNALATIIAAQASGIATAAGGGTTAAQFTALADLMTVLAQSKDLGRPALMKSKLTTREQLDAT